MIFIIDIHYNSKTEQGCFNVNNSNHKGSQQESHEVTPLSGVQNQTDP